MGYLGRVKRCEKLFAPFWFSHPGGQEDAQGHVHTVIYATHPCQVPRHCFRRFYKVFTLAVITSIDTTDGLQRDRRHIDKKFHRR